MPNCKQAIPTKHKMMHACETKQFKSKEPASPPWPSLETGTTSAKSHNQELLDLMAALTSLLLGHSRHHIPCYCMGRAKCSDSWFRIVRRLRFALQLIIPY